MIKKVSYTILSLFLLVTTVGLTISLHYCAGDLYSIGIDSQADNCCKNESHMNHTTYMDHEVVCHTNGNDKDNCNDETRSVKTVDYFTKTIQKINLNNNSIIKLFNIPLQDDVNLFSFNEEENNFDNSNNYLPNTRQILSLKESFLL